MRNLGDTLTQHKYTATFIRNGFKKGKSTALLFDVTNEEGKILTDHIWLVGGIWRAVKLTAGDIIEFLATPYRYIKGYSGSKHQKTEFQADIGLRDVHVNGVVGRNELIVGQSERMKETVDDDELNYELSEDAYKDLINSQFEKLAFKRAQRREMCKEKQKQRKKERKHKHESRNPHRDRSNCDRRRNNDDTRAPDRHHA